MVFNIGEIFRFGGIGPIIITQEYRHGITFTENVTQSNIVPNSPYVDCSCTTVWSCNHPGTISCPAGAIPYSTYSCNGDLEYNCTNPSSSNCPTLSNIILNGSKFFSPTLSSSGATLTCLYSYMPQKLTEQSIIDCNSNFPNSPNCAQLSQAFCSIEGNMLTNTCKNFCSENYCNGIYNFCQGSNLNSHACKHWASENATNKYDFSNAAKSYCVGSNLDTEACKNYCFGRNLSSQSYEIDCDDALRSYCSDENITSRICHCFRPRSYYDDKIKKHFSKVSNEILKETFVADFESVPPYCIGFLGCSKTEFKPKNIVPCEINTSICVANTEFINEGAFEVKCPENYVKSCLKFVDSCTSKITTILEENGKPVPSKYISPTIKPSPSVTPTTTPTLTPKPSPSTSVTVTKSKFNYYIIVYVGIGLLIIALIVGIWAFIHYRKK